MMLLTKQTAESIKKLLAVAPLAEGEIRHVAEMGGVYITDTRLASIDNSVGVDGEPIEITIGTMVYWFQYAVTIDGHKLYVYGGHPVVPPTQDS